MGPYLYLTGTIAGRRIVPLSSPNTNNTKKQRETAPWGTFPLFLFDYCAETQALAMASFRAFLVCSRSADSMAVGLKIRLKTMVQMAATTTAA